MVEQVWEGHACDSDAKVIHVGKVGLSQATGQMVLRKEDFLFGAMLGTPEHNTTLECANLARAIAVGVALAQQLKERFGLEGRVALQIGFKLGPVLSERVRAGAIGARLLELTGQF